MTINAIQPSFAAGEIAPNLWARVDLAKFHIGARTLRNFFVLPGGGAANRPGTAFVGRCKYGTTYPVRLIPFQFSTVQTYCLEFGHLYMRVIMQGGYVLETAKTVTGVTNASPGVVTSATHGFSNGDWVFFSGISGMTTLNSKTYIVANATTNTFTLTDLDGNAINTTSYVSYISGGTVARIYTLTTPYAGTDLASLKFVQSADTMTFCHINYAPYDLTRTGHAAWTITAITFLPSVQPPTIGTLTSSSGAGTWHYSYMVTAETDSPPEESLPSSAVTAALTQLNASTGVQNTITWTAPASGPAPTRYRIYKANQLNGVDPPAGSMYGYIGTSTGTSFVDINIAPDFTQTPPQGNNPLSGNNPGVVTYFQNRKVFAGSSTGPATMWLTQPSSFKNMDTSNPSQDSDAITATITNKQVNAIKHLVSVNALLALTSGGSFKISGGASGGALTPSAFQVTPQAYNGCADVPPIVIGNDILYVQAKGSRVRDLSYNFYADVFTGADMTILAPHLFYTHTIQEWAYAEEPFNMIWAVRDDGVMLGFTYLKEQDVYAWTRHDTNGYFKSVAAIPEGTEDATYVVVERTIAGVNGGAAVRYVERVASRNFLTNGVADVTKTWFVDCGVRYGGTASTTVTGLDHLNGATVSILGDGNVFPSQVVDNGQVTLSVACSTITVGLPYTCQIQTLNLDYSDQGGSIQGKRKKVSAVTMRLENARGLKVGHNFTSMYEVKERTTQTYGAPIPLTTGDERIVIDPSWETTGSICIQQDNPLPATVLAVIPEVRLGDTPG